MATTQDKPQKKYRVMTDAEPDDDVLPQDYKAFAFESKPSHALINFHFRNGDQQSLAYGHLYHVSFDRSDGLVLTFSEHLVQIRGSNLRDMHRYLTRNAVIWVWEANDQQQLIAEDNTSIVTEVNIVPRFNNTLIS